MDSPLPITNLGIVLAPPAEVEGGLLAWASVDYGGLRLDGLAVRLTERGDILVTFPSKPKYRGRRQYIVWPLDEQTRDRFQTAVLKAYIEERRRQGLTDGEAS